MIRPLKKPSPYKSGHVYSKKKFAWFPINVLDIYTNEYYKVWFDSYYENKTARVNQEGNIYLPKETALNSLPYREWITLKEHPLHGMPYPPPYPTTARPADPFETMRKEIVDVLANAFADEED